MARLGQFSGSQVTTTIPTSAVSPIARQPTPKPSSTGEKLKSGLKSYLNWLNPVTAVPKLLSSKPVQKVVDVFNIPLYATAGALKAVEKPELEQGLRPSISREWSTPSNISLAISGAKQGLKEKTMLGDVLRQREEMGQEQSKLKKAGAFVSDIAFPSLPVAKLVSGTAKVSKAVGVTDKASDILRPVFNLTKKVSDIPAVQKVAEAVSPGYKVPEVRNIIKEAEEVANTRVNQLARTIKEAAKGLSKAQQERVGQLMEGGVTATGDSKLALIAKQMNNLADEIGAEGVALWEKTNGKFGLNPESYLKFKGKYLTHIWSEMTEGGKKTVSYINKPGGISGQFYKLRKGAEGYTRQFAPATFKGLGTQVRDIELSKAYLKVAEKYGIPMEKLQKPESVVAEAINVLLKEHKTPKVGLGTPNFSGTMEIPPKGVGEVYPSQNIANYLLDVFKKYQPAHRLSQAEEQAQGIYTGLAKAELTGKTAQPIEEWVRRNGAAFQQVFHFTPDESSLRAFISQVGELPAVKGSKLKLDVGKAERLVTEGFGYAPEMVRKMGVSKLFEDVGLPQEVIDYINFVSKTPNHNLFDDALNAWKVGKTILNPAYHFRNIFSNQVLAGWATGKNIFSTTVDSVKAFYKLHQGDDIIFKAAEDSNTINAKSFVKNLQEFMDEADLVANKGRLQRYVNWWKKFQQTSEDTAKLNVFTFKIEEVARKSGRQVAEVLTDPKVIKMAKDAAEEAIFSPYRISIGERELLKRIIPFYAFTRQALPFYAKTLYKTPGRVLPYHRLKPAIESQLTNLVPEEKRAEWQKQQIQLPKAVSKLLGVKEPVALDTTYLMPQGNFGEDFGTSLGKGQLPFGLSINPFAMEIMQQIFGKDLYFDQPFGQGALPGADVKDILSTNPVRRTSERIDHALNTLAPALYRTIKGKVYPAFAEKPDYAGRERSKTMAILDALGIKMSVLRPEDQVKFQSYDQYQLIEQIKSEMRSIAKDQSRSPAQKQKLLEEYMKELQKVATGK